MHNPIQNPHNVAEPADARTATESSDLEEAGIAVVPPFHPTRRKRSRNKYVVWIDLFGIVAALATVAYYVVAHRTTAPDQELFTLWANICTEAVGIYVSVRVLEFLVRNNQERRTARIGLVRNSRFLLRLARTATYHVTPLNIDNINHEMDYTDYIFSRRKRFLTEDERECLNAFYIALCEHSALLRSVGSHAGPGPIPRSDAERLRTSLESVEVKRHIAEQNIFEETAEE
jgi:hypothetical protein